MKVEFLGAYGGSTSTSNLTSLLIDDCLAIDAGCLTQTLTLERQKQIDDVFISHSHLDHTLSLPFLADNLFELTERPLRIWSSQTVLEALREHIFNEVTWPDFTQLPSPDKPTINFFPIEAERSVDVQHFNITPIAVNHVVPCTGFLIESTISDSCILFTSDTVNTDRVWAVANTRPNLKAVIVDCSFPNEMEELARASGHMTPALLRRDLDKLKVDCEILIYHIKPTYRETMIRQLKALNHPRIQIMIQSKTMTF